MTATLSWTPRLADKIENGQWYSDGPFERQGVMLHYDASTSDLASVNWFKHRDCRVSYNWLVLDSGAYVEIAGWDNAAWHAGVCRPSRANFTYASANRAFYGIAAATDSRVDVTPLQLLTIAWLTKRVYERENWPATDLWRITTHSAEAWPRGRKTDPEGIDPKNPIYSASDIRSLLWHVS